MAKNSMPSFNPTFLNQLAPNLEGIALIDKPSGMTSHDVVNLVRKKTQIKRVGHCGTLDPLASGLLIILIGRAYTKLQDQFLKLDKQYLVEAQLGISTDSYDIEGKITHQTQEELIKQVTKDQLQTVVKTFFGQQNQQVPIFSAVKIGGKKLYQLARAQRQKETLASDALVGKKKATVTNAPTDEIETSIANTPATISATTLTPPPTDETKLLPSRIVNFYDLELLNFGQLDNAFNLFPQKKELLNINTGCAFSNTKNLPITSELQNLDSKTNKMFFTLKVHCSSGTYVRSLIHDIGQKLLVAGKPIGATVSNLRRTAVGEYEVERAIGV